MRDVELGRSFQCISLNVLLVGKFEIKFVDLVEKYIICLVGINFFFFFLMSLFEQKFNFI